MTLLSKSLQAHCAAREWVECHICIALHLPCHAGPHHFSEEDRLRCQRRRVCATVHPSSRHHIPEVHPDWQGGDFRHWSFPRCCQFDSHRHYTKRHECDVSCMHRYEGWRRRRCGTAARTCSRDDLTAVVPLVENPIHMQQGHRSALSSQSSSPSSHALTVRPNSSTLFCNGFITAQPLGQHTDSRGWLRPGQDHQTHAIMLITTCHSSLY